MEAECFAEPVIGRASRDPLARNDESSSFRVDRKTSKGSHHVDTAANWSCAVSKGDPARFHRAAAGFFQRAWCHRASDLETDRAGASDSVMSITPTITFADCPQLDVICVPGGIGTDDMVNDAEMLDFLRQQALGAKYVTSVCTGSLVLGAAGLLKGYRATTHWSAMDHLAPFGAVPTKTRVCVDRNRISGGGVTAGIDFALTLVSMHDRPADGGGDPAAAGIQSGTAVQLGLARYRAGRNPRAHEGKNCTIRAPPRRGGRARRGAAGLTLLEKESRSQKKKAARFPGRPFLILRQHHIDGRFQNFRTGGLSPSRILIGCRCKSGQSRTGARTVRDGFPSP